MTMTRIIEGKWYFDVDNGPAGKLFIPVVRYGDQRIGWYQRALRRRLRHCLRTGDPISIRVALQLHENIHVIGHTLHMREEIL